MTGLGGIVAPSILSAQPHVVPEPAGAQIRERRRDGDGRAEFERGEATEFGHAGEHQLFDALQDAAALVR